MTRKLLLSLIAVFSIHSFVNAQCLEVTSIFVNSCTEGSGTTNCTTEGPNEMFTFTVGVNDLFVDDISVNWPNNTFQGWCQSPTTALKTDTLNSTITSTCGWLLEPTNDTLPANANVIVITSSDFCASANSFSNLADTMYIIYQCAGNMAGHFANNPGGPRTLQINVTGGCTQIESVTYDGSIPNSNGATAFFDAAGTVSYAVLGCNAPVISLSADWSFTDEICNDYGIVDLSTLLASNATLGGTWSGPHVSGSNYDPTGYTGLDSITYEVMGSGSCTDTTDSTIVFMVTIPQAGALTLQSCDSVFYGGQWYTSNTMFTDTTFRSGFECDSFTNVNIIIDNAITDSTYLFACDSIQFNGIWYTQDTIIRDTVLGGGGGTVIDTILETSFEDSEGWVDHSSGNWTQVDANGTWTANGMYANQFNPNTGIRNIGMNDVGDYIELPPVSNPQTLYYYDRLSSAPTGTNEFTIEYYDGSSWVALGSDICTHTNYEIVTIDLTAISLLTNVSIRIIRTQDNRSGYIDDIVIEGGVIGGASCDSIFITTIDINTPELYDTVFQCTNNPALAGNDNDTLFYASGCDSLITTTITTFVDTSFNPIVLSGCDTVNYNGVDYIVSTNFTDTVQSSLACDSIYNVVTITVNQSVTSQNPNNPIIICATNDSTLLPDGSYAYTAGTYNSTLPASNGCDSIVETIVQVQSCVSSCTFDTVLYDSYEYVGAIPGLVPGATYHPNTTEAVGTFAGRARTGNRFFYMNFQNGYAGQVYTRTIDVCAGSEFRYSFWIRQYSNAPGSDIDINIYDGTGTTGTLIHNQNVVNNGTIYNQITSPQLVATSNQITFELVTNAVGANGNDLCFDDLLIEVCQLDTTDLGIVPLCNNGDTVNLFDYITSPVSTNGTWNGPSTLSNGHLGTFDPNMNTFGEYSYSIAGVFGCGDTIYSISTSALTSSNGILNLVACDSINYNGTTYFSSQSINDTIFNGSTNGCDSTYLVNITINSTPLIHLGPDITLCNGEDTLLDATTTNASYLWQDNTTTSATFLAANTGLYWADVTVNGCTGRDSVDVVINPTYNQTATQSICDGDSAFLAGQWQFIAGNYIDNFITINGCDSIISTDLVVQSAQTVNDQIEVCEDELPVDIFGQAVSTPGLYSDTLQSALGCDSLIQNVNLTVNALPTIQLGNDTTIDEGDVVEVSILNPQANTTYTWINSEGESYTGESIFVNNTVSATYIVTATNAFNCDNTDSILVIVNPLADVVAMVPTAFSPNNDGVNDIFRIANYEDFSSYILRVYNRWGELIFDNEGYNAAWDGRFNGTEQNIGVYVYYIEANPANGSAKIILSGNFNLIR